MNLGEKLAGVREIARMTRAQLSAHLKRKSFDVKTYTICKWETGISKPTVEEFLAVCDICKVMDIRQSFVNKRLLRLYDIPASAGSGNYLTDSSYEMIEVDDLVPESADYAIRVKGDSMTPRFVNRQIIFIHEQTTLDEGETGIFSLNNDAYVKKLGRGCLISLNPEYSPIPIREHDSLKVFGKVVG